MSNYYCLVAGLPQLSMDEGKPSFTSADFKTDIYPYLSAADRKQIDLFYLQFDNASLLALLRGEEPAVDDTKGLYASDELKQLIDAVRKDEQAEVQFPPYIYSFIQRYLEQKNEEGFSADDQLATLYYDYALKHSNAFVRDWFAFNLNVNNLLAALTARKFNLKVADYIVGEGEVPEAIRNSNARDFGLTPVLDYLDTVLHIAETTDLVEKEKRIDQLKWDWMENETFFHYFSVERLFAFLVKLELIERWIQLDKETGRAKFREIINNLKEEVEVPQEFR